MDFVSDNNPVGLWRADRLVGAPAYVGEAPVLTPEDCDQLPAAAFADPLRRELPVHTKAATWLSAATFYGADRRDRRIEAALTKAAAGHGIAPDVDKLCDVLRADTAKQAAARPEPRFALWGDFGHHIPGGSHHAFYPINNAIETIASGTQLLADAKRLPVELFSKAAREIVKAAADYGVPAHELHPRLVSAGTERLPDFETAGRHAELRARAVSNPDAGELYREIVKTASGDEEHLESYVELWADLDRTHGVRYGRGIVTPHEAFFSGMTRHEFDKLAAASVVIHGVVVPREAVQAVSDDTLRQHFPKAAAETLGAVVGAAGESGEQLSARVAACDPGVQREFLRLVLRETAPAA